MARLQIRYFTARRGKRGGVRYFWQPSATLQERGWKTTRLPDDPTAAQAEAKRLNAALDAWYAGHARPVHGATACVDALIADYKRSARYKEKAPKTRRFYDENLSILSRLMGDHPVRTVRPSHVQKIYEGLAARTPARAAAVVRVGRLLWSHGRRVDLADENPWSRPGMKHRAAKGRLWTPDDVRAFAARADAMGYFSIGTAVLLNEWLGQRKGDLVALRRSMYRDGMLRFAQGKTGAEVALPVDMVPALKARMDEQLRRNAAGRVVSGAIIQTMDGRPYTLEGFGSAFDRIRIEAARTHPALERLVFKDLRHTAVTRLGEAGVELQEIAAVTGHTFTSCQQILDRYNVRTGKMARNAFGKRLAAESNAERMMP